MSKLKIIPEPCEIKLSDGSFTLTAEHSISFNENGRDAASLLASYLKDATGYPLALTDNSDAAIRIESDGRNQKDDAGFTDESYKISVTSKRIKISSLSNAGAAMAVQTLRQLFQPEIFSRSIVSGKRWEIPCLEISDKPLFRWRGMHFDVSRHFFSVDEVERFIDLLALHKFNVLHLHLTDDQGWRVEIKKYPRLTEIGAKRECSLIGHEAARPRKYDGIPHGGFFSQNDIRRLVKFADARHITIVPEIDMPGHMQAAIAAYPELGNLNMPVKPRCHWGISQHILNVEDSTVDFMKNVLSEIMDLFPSRFIHVGGDEAVKHEWMESHRVQERMIELGVKDEHDLQGWFIDKMNSHIRANGRRLIGWDEIMKDDLASNAAVMCWRVSNSSVDAVNTGHDSVTALCSHLYFDHYQCEPVNEEPLAIGGMSSAGKVYSFDPVFSGVKENKKQHILGAQGQLWSEYIPDMKQMELMAFPRACALSETLWTPKEKRSFKDFLSRLDYHRKRLSMLNVNVHPQPVGECQACEK